MEKSNDRNDRALFRLRFPNPERASLSIADQKYVVVELSEGGCRILAKAGQELQIDQGFKGSLDFGESGSDEVEGSVFRQDGEELILKLSTGVTTKRMMQLQIALRKKYPMFFETKKESGLAEEG